MKKLPIRMKSDGVAEILLYGVVGSSFFEEGVTAKDFRQELKKVTAGTLNVRINSPGGDVIEGAAIMAALDEFKGEIIVDVDGLAASAASVIAMAGDTIRVSANGLMMIHNPMTITIGTAADHLATAEVLTKVKGQIIASYQRHSDAGEQQLSDWMDAESWFTGQEAVDAGLADEVTEPVQLAALADGSRLLDRFKYKHAPKLAAVAQEAAWQETRRRREIAARL